MPRIAPLDDEEPNAEMLATLAEIRPGPVPNVFATYARFPELLSRVVGLGRVIIRATELDTRTWPRPQ